MEKSKINSIDFDNWKQYIGDITTNARWISKFNNKPVFGNWLMPKRNYLPKIPDDVKSHHGIWVAEIPYQMINRFTKNK